jgi:hypothetical protein
MPLLLTESLDAARREHTHQHIESCVVCSDEWSAYKDTWAMMGDLPEVDVPARVKQNFLDRAGVAQELPKNVVPFHRKPAFKWMAQAAAIVVLVGGAYFLGDRNADRFIQTGVTVEKMPLEEVSTKPYHLAETRVLDAEALSPEFEGRPNITNVQFVDADPSDDQIGVSFDVTSRWTVNGNPRDKSMVRLLAYMLENEAAVTPRANALEWVRQTYSDPQFADPEIANALAKVLRNDSHEGARIRAVETLTTLPPTVGLQTRDALIEALRSDPNPAVRIKAVEALANMARNGAVLDAATVDTLRQKASQDDENLYVRVKAAEVLGSIKP